MSAKPPAVPPAVAAVEPLQDQDVQIKLGLFLGAGASVAGYVVHQRDGTRALLIRGGPAKRLRAFTAAPAPSGPPMVNGLWSFTDHLCRECLGRIMERMDGTEAGCYRCSMCRASARGTIEAICACRIQLGKVYRDMGFRCMVNPAPTFQFPHEIVVSRVDPSEGDQQLAQPALPLRTPR